MVRASDFVHHRPVAAAEIGGSGIVRAWSQTREIEGMPANIHDVQAVGRARRQLPTARQRARLERARRALCEPARVQILRALMAEELCVNDLATVIGRPAETTSQHLRVLRELDAVEWERRGRTVYYRMSPRGRTTFVAALDDIERRLTPP